MCVELFLAQNTISTLPPIAFITGCHCFYTRPLFPFHCINFYKPFAALLVERPLLAFCAGDTHTLSFTLLDLHRLWSTMWQINATRWVAALHLQVFINATKKGAKTERFQKILRDIPDKKPARLSFTRFDVRKTVV